VWPGFDVARALCDESRDAQLMVVGRGRYTGRTRVMRGLAAQNLLDFAGCPVAVVPHA
jgi:nucleotide-binding universal stress UspA family protein